MVASGACNQSHAQGALVFGGAPRTEQRVTLPLHGRVTVQEGAVQGIVLVAKFCRTARRCLHLQEWHDCAVQCTLAVAKHYRAARRCVYLQSWHDSEVISTVAVAIPCGAARRCVHLQDWHGQGVVAVAKLYGAARRCMQLLDWHDFAVQGTVKDAVLTKKTCVLQCSTTMLAPARLARLRGAMHRGGGQTLRCSATMQHLQDWHDSAV